METPKEEQLRLSERVKRGAMWGIGIDFVNQAGQILLSLVLVRMLNPEVYGQAGILNALLLFVGVFSMQSFMERALFARDDSSIHHGSYWALGVMLHGLLFVIVNIMAVVLLYVPKYALIAPYLHLMSFGLLLNVPRVYWTVLLQRNFDWRRLRTLKILSVVLYAIVAISLAAAGYGLLALVIQAVIVPLPFVVDCLLKQRHLLRFEIDGTHFRDTLRFGGLRSINGVLAAGLGVLEGAQFVHVLGFASYGIYGRAFGITKMTSGTLPSQVTTQIFPGLARLTPGSESANKSCAMLLRLTLWLSLPLGIVCAVAPADVVHVLYGHKWESVIPLLPIAVLVTIIGVLRSVVGTLVLTNIGPGKLLVANIICLSIIAAALFVALPYGVVLYIQIVALANLMGLAYALGLLVRRGALAKGDLARALGAPILVGLLVFVLLKLLPLQAFMDRSQIATLIALSAFSCAVFFYAIRILDPAGLRGVLNYVPAGPLIRRVALLGA